MVSQVRLAISSEEVYDRRTAETSELWTGRLTWAGGRRTHSGSQRSATGDRAGIEFRSETIAGVLEQAARLVTTMEAEIVGDVRNDGRQGVE